MIFDSSTILNEYVSTHKNKIPAHYRVLAKSYLTIPLQNLLFSKTQSDNYPNQKDIKHKLRRIVGEKTVKVSMELAWNSISVLNQPQKVLKNGNMRGPGFEPGLTPRKGVVLPLDYPR